MARLAPAAVERCGVGVDGGDGRQSAALFRLGKWRGAAELSEEGTASGEGGGTAPVSPAYKEEEANVTLFPNKEPPTISPTTPRSTRAVTGGRGGYGVRFGITQARACPCPVLGLAQQRSAPCMAQARGLLSVY